MMPTCRYCWTPYEADRCPKCEEEHRRVSALPAKGSAGRKRGRPTIDIQEGNRNEAFSDSYDERDKARAVL